MKSTKVNNQINIDKIIDIISTKGCCYTVIKEFENKCFSQNRTIFAIHITPENICQLKDLTLNDVLCFNKKKVKLFIGLVLTNNGDTFNSLDNFLKYYEPTLNVVKKFINNINLK